MIRLEDRTPAEPGHACDMAPKGRGDGGGCGLTRRTLLGALASLVALHSLPCRAVLARPAAPPEVAARDEDFVLVDGWVLPVRYFRT